MTAGWELLLTAATWRPTSHQSFVFGTRTGRPLHQRNVLRALYVAQERARNDDGRPTFPELYAKDARGHLVVDDSSDYVLATVMRSELRLPTFHALRHGAAMDCDDAEEARDLLRHKNSNVTRAIYRAHFGDRRRELLAHAWKRVWKQRVARIASGADASPGDLAFRASNSATGGSRRRCSLGLHTREVAGSKPAAPTSRKPRHGGVSTFRGVGYGSPVYISAHVVSCAA